MMRPFVLIFVLIAFSAPSYAQNNTITVVGEDGTKTSIDIGPVTGGGEPSPQAKSAASEKTVKPQKKAPKKPEATKQKKAAPKSAKKPDAAKKPAAKKAPAKKASVNKAPTNKDSAPKPKTAASPAAPSGMAPAREATPVKQQDAPATAPAQNLGPNMTPDDAIRRALDSAPPASSVHAVPVNYKGLHAYQVIFDTEDGDRSIFIDRETGRIVK